MSIILVMGIAIIAIVGVIVFLAVEGGDRKIKKPQSSMVTVKTKDKERY